MKLYTYRHTFFTEEAYCLCNKQGRSSPEKVTRNTDLSELESAHSSFFFFFLPRERGKSNQLKVTSVTHDSSGFLALLSAPAIMHDYNEKSFFFSFLVRSAYNRGLKLIMINIDKNLSIGQMKKLNEIVL